MIQVISSHNISLNCSDQDVWKVVSENYEYYEFYHRLCMLCNNVQWRNVDDVTKLPCVSLSKCLSAPELSGDTVMTVVNESVTTYRCNEDKYLNFSSLQYPQEINATCSDNKIFQDKLPFWTIDQRILPLNEDSLCLGTTECSLPPSDISEMIHTWNGSKLVESSFQYSCHDWKWR